MGYVYFDARDGNYNITSELALKNALDLNINLGRNYFINHPYMKETIIDFDFSEDHRKGRLLSFMAFAAH